MLVKSIERFGVDKTFDIWVHDPECQDIEGGNYFIDGILSHNSIPEAVANRDDKKGTWRAKLREIHPILEEILSDTYGIILWQEQLAAIWQRLGGFTSPEAQEARKAVAKKHTHKLKDIGKKWLAGATPNIGKENAEKLWESMVSFGRYAFNKCLDKDTVLRDANTGTCKTIEEWFNSYDKPFLESYINGQVVVDECVAVHDTGEQEVFEVEFDNGQKEFVTFDHKFLCVDEQFHTVREIIDKGLEIKEVKAD